MSGGGDAYEAREREVIQQLALRVLGDPKSTPVDRAAARSRLVGEEKEPDYGLCSIDELRVVVAIEHKAQGRDDHAPGMADPVLHARSTYAVSAQNVADDARDRLDEAFASSSRPDSYYRPERERRCASCGRLDEKHKVTP